MTFNYRITTLLIIFVFSLFFSSNVLAGSEVKNYKDARKAFFSFNPDRLNKAIEYYNKTLAENPNDANALAGLSETYSLLGFYKKDVHDNYENEYNLAYDNILKAMKIDKENINVKRALAYNYLYLSREKEAAVIAKEILSKKPDDYESMYIFWSAKGQKIDNPNIHKALRNQPELVIGYVELAKSYFYKKRKYTKAALQIEAALKQSDTPYLRDLLGTIYRTQRSLKKSIEQYEEALKQNGNFPPALKDLGISLFYKGSSQESVAMLKKSITLNPTFPDAYFYLASNYQRMGNKELARVNYTTFIKEASDQMRYIFLVKKAKTNLNQINK
ncbi:MAG: tetratricopeptide repeat protein [Thermodesulfobacteriota bacterium]